MDFAYKMPNQDRAKIFLSSEETNEGDEGLENLPDALQQILEAFNENGTSDDFEATIHSAIPDLIESISNPDIDGNERPAVARLVVMLNGDNGPSFDTKEASFDKESFLPLLMGGLGLAEGAGLGAIAGAAAKKALPFIGRGMAVNALMGGGDQSQGIMNDPSDVYAHVKRWDVQDDAGTLHYAEKIDKELEALRQQVLAALNAWSNDDQSPMGEMLKADWWTKLDAAKNADSIAQLVLLLQSVPEQYHNAIQMMPNSDMGTGGDGLPDQLPSTNLFSNGPAAEAGGSQPETGDMQGNLIPGALSSVKKATVEVTINSPLDFNQIKDIELGLSEWLGDVESAGSGPNGRELSWNISNPYDVQDAEMKINMFFQTEYPDVDFNVESNTDGATNNEMMISDEDSDWLKSIGDGIKWTKVESNSNMTGLAMPDPYSSPTSGNPDQSNTWINTKAQELIGTGMDSASAFAQAAMLFGQQQGQEQGLAMQTQSQPLDPTSSIGDTTTEVYQNGQPHNLPSATTASTEMSTIEKEVPMGLEDAEAIPVKDIQNWKDSEGVPLKEGQTYKMTAGYDIPDVVRVIGSYPGGIRLHIENGQGGYEVNVNDLEQRKSNYRFEKMAHALSSNEQLSIIEEGGVARNLDRLNLSHSHYEDEFPNFHSSVERFLDPTIPLSNTSILEDDSLLFS